MLHRHPKLKIVRRFNVPIPTLTAKHVSRKKNKRPGEHPFFNSRKTATKLNYFLKFLEKQKLKYIYGLTEKRLKTYITTVYKFTGPNSNIIDNLYNLLELRFDCLLVRLNFAKTISEARQFITHGFFYLNKKRIRMPSFRCKPGDLISTNSILALSNYENLSRIRDISKYLEKIDVNNALILHKPSNFLHNRQVEYMFIKTLEFY